MKLELYKQQILNDYASGITIKSIANHINCHVDSIRKFLQKNNIKTLTRSEASRKYTFNQHFFDYIDTEEKAYILGLLSADGYNQESKNTISLTLVEKDKHILEKISSVIESNRPLYFLNKKQYNKNNQDCYRLDFTSEHLSKTLSKLGCCQRKSLIFKFPDINKKLWRHFIRGYFDGDGCICYSVNNVGYVRNIVNIVGSIYFCQYLQIILKSWNISSNILIDKRANENVRIISFGGRNLMKRFYKILYNKSFMFFNRKKEKFEEFFTLSSTYLKNKKSSNVYKNIQGCKNPWRVIKTYKSKSKTIGTYFTYEDAISASQEWDKLHGNSVL